MHGREGDIIKCSQLNNVFPGTSDAEPDSNAHQHSLKKEGMNSQGRARGRRGESLEKGVVVPVRHWKRVLSFLCVCVCECVSDN